MHPPAPGSNRPLHIDFNLYTDGDEVYKKELIALFIGNLKELQFAQQQSAEQQDQKIFLIAGHKIKTTLSILNDDELTAWVGKLSQPISDDSIWPPKEGPRLNEICAEIIHSLEKECQ